MYYNKEEVERFVENFGLNEDDAFTEDDADFMIADITNFGIPNFDWDTGATKLVIMPEQREYVIKIPFNGYYDEGHFYHFEGAESDYCDNYCEAENRLYMEATVDGFEELFLPNEYVCDVDCYPIYVQPKAEVLNKSESQEKYSSKESKEKILQRIKEDRFFTNLPASWLASCLDVLGSMEEVNKFLKFLDMTGISADLHYGNLGYYHGHAVIIDYGGYDE